MSNDVVVGSGSASVKPLGPLLGSGVASSLAPARDGDGDGSAGINRTLFNAWATSQETVYGCAHVAIDGEDVGQLLTGAVKIQKSIDSPVSQAAYEILDERAASFAGASLTFGDKPTTIRLRAGPLNKTQVSGLFIGTQYDGPTDEPFTPHANAKAQGFSAWYLDQPICFNAPAFAGLRRFRHVIIPIGAALGLTIRAFGPGRIITNPIRNFTGKFGELVAAYCEIEGAIAREAEDGALEIVQAFRLPPKMAFSEHDSVSQIQLAGVGAHGNATVSETPPTRPPTTYQITYSSPDVPSSSYTTTGDPFVAGDVVEVTVTNGGETRRRTITRAVVATPGVTENPPFLQIVKIVDVRTLWNETTITLRDGTWQRAATNQIVDRTTDTYELTSPLAATTGFYEWTDGSFHADSQAVLGQTASVYERFTYGADCLLLRHQVTVKGLYSPLSGTASNLYADGTVRFDPYYRLVDMRTDDTWFSSSLVPPTWTKETTTSSMWTVTGAGPTETFELHNPVVEQWIDDGAGGYTHYKTDGTSEHGQGDVPIPPIAGAADPQYTLTTRTAARSVNAPFSPLTVVEMNPHIEDGLDVSRLCAWRFIRSFGTRFLWPSTIIPHLLPGDCVTVASRARSIPDPLLAIVESVEFSVGVLNFEHDQAPQLLVPPEGIALP